MTDRPDPFAPRGRPDPFLPRQRPDPFAPSEVSPPPVEPPAPEPEPRAGQEPLWQRKDGVDFDKPLPPPQIPGAEEEAKQKAKRFGGPIGFILLILWKVGRIALVFLGKIALLFKIPVLGSVLSGAISIGAYAVFYGWTFAIGLVGSLLVHELGHVFQIRREGMPVKALNFVPFLGAYVMSDAARTRDQQARISIAGPVAGTILAVVIHFAVPADNYAVQAVAYTGFFLNLLNLLPIPMLDGGGVGQVFPAAWWLMLVAPLALVWLGTGEEFAAIAAIAAIFMTFARRSGGFALEPADGVPLAQRIQAAVLYVAVVAVCAFGMSETFQNRTDDLVNQYGSAPGATAVVSAQAALPQVSPRNRP